MLATIIKRSLIKLNAFPINILKLHLISLLHVMNNPSQISFIHFLVIVFCFQTLKSIFHCDAKIFALGPCVGLDPLRQNFASGIPTCWYLKTRKFALPPTPNLKFALPPTRNLNASHWNIGCVGSQMQISRIGHIHFIFFVSISFALGSQFPVEYGL